ncbi:hypothetical protein KUF57_21865 [Mycolicibacterium sp. PAM1]|nr:hypothetical protein [Mycolicibacterium sp. PAM1]
MTPLRVIAARRAGSSHTSRIGTCGHLRTCQWALVIAFHALSEGTSSPLTSTMTASGSSRAALMMLSRTSWYVEPSNVPVIVSAVPPPGPGVAETCTVLLRSTIGCADTRACRASTARDRSVPRTT